VDATPQALPADAAQPGLIQPVRLLGMLAWRAEGAPGQRALLQDASMLSVRGTRPGYGSG